VAEGDVVAVDALCSVTVNRGDGRYVHFEPCGRKAVEDGLCKLHLRVRDQRAAKDAEYRERVDFGDRMQAEAERLSERLGVPVRADYNALSRPSGYTGRMIVPRDWLAQIAERAEEVTHLLRGEN
jgi:hypothetical protein